MSHFKGYESNTAVEVDVMKMQEIIDSDGSLQNETFQGELPAADGDLIEEFEKVETQKPGGGRRWKEIGGASHSPKGPSMALGTVPST